MPVESTVERCESCGQKISSCTTETQVNKDEKGNNLVELMGLFTEFSSRTLTRLVNVVNTGASPENELDWLDGHFNGAIEEAVERGLLNLGTMHSGSAKRESLHVTKEGALWMDECDKLEFSLQKWSTIEVLEEGNNYKLNPIVLSGSKPDSVVNTLSVPGHVDHMTLLEDGLTVIETIGDEAFLVSTSEDMVEIYATVES